MQASIYFICVFALFYLPFHLAPALFYLLFHLAPAIFQDGIILCAVSLLRAPASLPAESFSALGTEIEILIGLISAGRAPADHASRSPAADQGQILLAYLSAGSPGYLFSHCRIQFVDSAAAGHLNIIFTHPPEAGDKKEQQLAEGHKDLVSPVLSALAAYNQLIRRNILSSL